MRHDDTTVALEAAHIKWKQHGGPCEIPNGLALCAIHHKAFDKGSIGLDENMRVLVSDAVNGGGIVERLFWDFDGKTITLPQVRKITLLRVCGVASEEVFGVRLITIAVCSILLT